MFAVWSQGRQLADGSGRFRSGRDVADLFSAAGTNVFTVKLGYWIGRWGRTAGRRQTLPVWPRDVLSQHPQALDDERQLSLGAEVAHAGDPRLRVPAEGNDEPSVGSVRSGNQDQLPKGRVGAANL